MYLHTAYLQGKTANWEPGSLGDVVESVVKTFEFEISHKVRHVRLSLHCAAPGWPPVLLRRSLAELAFS